MSFAQDVKAEITSRRISQRCCMQAACYGIACFGKYFDERGIVLQTETEAVANYARKLFHRCGVNGHVTAIERQNSRSLEFAVKEPDEVEKALNLFGHTGKETNLRINPKNFKCAGCYNAFMAAAFLCSGTMTDPEKEYNLEFFTPKFNLSKDFEGILAEHEFQPHRTVRKGANVIYIKASERIEDLLAYMGAGNSAMQVMNSKLYKDMRNKTNRISNCETANLGKTVQAAVQVRKAVQYLKEQKAYDALPVSLVEAAEKRLSYPEMNLSELAALFDPPLSKSGLSHRYKKIIEIAERLQEKQKNA